MGKKKKDENGEEYEVAAVVTDLEIRKFVDLQARKNALNSAIKAAMVGLADELEDSEKAFRRHWDRLRKKYNLRGDKKYSVDHDSREVRFKTSGWL